MHGGGFMHGDLDVPEADHVARGLVARAGAVVVSVDYRLAAEGGVSFPAPHEDCMAAFSWTAAHAAELGIDADRLAVGGGSAGGNLAAGVALHLRHAGAPPWQALLAYPIVHPVLPPASPELARCLSQIPPAVRLTSEPCREMVKIFLGGEIEDATPYAFAGLADDLTGYPPTYIENSEFDDLRASGEAFAEALAEAGVDVECVSAAGVTHGHLNAAGSPLTRASLDRFAARLRRP
jgi:xylan 1,4-beta-xylosidase